MSDIENIMAQVVPLGDNPTPQEIDLGQAVKESINNHPARIKPAPPDHIRNTEVVRALLDARNAIDAALAIMERFD
jgi:hypothetical protein